MRGYAFLLVYLWSLTLILKTPFNGVLVWYAVSFGNFHTLIWDYTLSTLPYAYVVAIVTGISWLFSRTEKKKLPATPLVILTILFSLWVTITSLFALPPEEDVWFKWTWFQKILLMCLIGFALTTTRERVNQLIWVVVLSIGFWGVKGAISFPLHGGGKGIHGPDGVSSPMMAELQTNIDAMRTSFYRAVRLTAAIAVPTSAGIALVANEAVSVLLGPKWLTSVPLLRLLCVYAAVRAVDVLLPPVLFARHRERFLLWYCLALLIVTPTAAVIGALWYGALGAVVFLTPAYSAVMAIMAKEALAEIKGSFSELWSEIWPILAAATAMAAVVLLLREFAFAGLTHTPLIGLLLLSACGAAAYLTDLLAMGSPVIGEGAQVAGWILRRRGADS